MKRICLLILLCSGTAFGLTTNFIPAGRSILLIANFDKGKKTSAIGGDFGSWVKDPNDFTQKCVESFSSRIRHGAGGYSLKVSYDVDSPNDAYGGVWFKLNCADFEGFKKLVFWVKGDRVRGYSKVFKMELKNSKGEVGAYYVSSVSGSWSKVIIPLALFHIKDYSCLKELVLVLEDKKVTQKEGIFYIDQIHLER